MLQLFSFYERDTEAQRSVFLCPSRSQNMSAGPQRGGTKPAPGTFLRATRLGGGQRGGGRRAAETRQEAKLRGHPVEEARLGGKPKSPLAPTRGVRRRLRPQRAQGQQPAVGSERGCAVGVTRAQYWFVPKAKTRGQTLAGRTQSPHLPATPLSPLGSRERGRRAHLAAPSRAQGVFEASWNGGELRSPD